MATRCLTSSPKCPFSLPPWEPPPSVSIAYLKCYSWSPAFETLLFPSPHIQVTCPPCNLLPCGCWPQPRGIALQWRDVPATCAHVQKSPFAGRVPRCCLTLLALLPLQVLPCPSQESRPQTSWDTAYVTSYVCREDVGETCYQQPVEQALNYVLPINLRSQSSASYLPPLGAGI